MRCSHLAGSVAFRLSTVGAASVGAATLLAVGLHDAGAASTSVELRDAPAPALVELPAGGVLMWHNVDSVRHRVRSVGDGEEFDSGDLDPGGTFSHAFNGSGTYVYVDRRKETDTASFGMVVVGAAAAPARSPSPGAAAPPASSGPVTVDVRDYSFSPATATVAPGATVTFHNTGAAAHSATARDGSFDVMIAPGASTTVTLARPGTYSYYCKFHPQMVGSITVVGAAATGPTPAAPAAPAAPTPVAATPPAQARTGGVAATLRDFRFAAAVVRARVGQAVTWTNRGAVPHSVTALNGSFDSGAIAPGASWTHVFRRKGVYRIVCAFHPQMRAQVVVRPRRR